MTKDIRKIPTLILEDGAITLDCGLDELHDMTGIEDRHALPLALDYLVAIFGHNQRTEHLLNIFTEMLAKNPPEDLVELTLLQHMFVCNHASMVMLEKSIKTRVDDVAEAYGGLARKFLQTYLQQVQALEKYRRKGCQTVRVENVTITGGQNIVGAVCKS